MDNTVQQKKKNNLFSVLQYSLNDSYRILHSKHTNLEIELFYHFQFSKNA